MSRPWVEVWTLTRLSCLYCKGSRIQVGLFTAGSIAFEWSQVDRILLDVLNGPPSDWPSERRFGYRRRWASSSRTGLHLDILRIKSNVERGLTPEVLVNALRLYGRLIYSPKRSHHGIVPNMVLNNPIGNCPEASNSGQDGFFSMVYGDAPFGQVGRQVQA